MQQMKPKNSTLVEHVNSQPKQGPGAVACEECGEWYHFECVGVNDISADSIQRDSVFISVTIFCTMTSVHSLKTFLKTLRINIMTRLIF